ncbi:MAG: metal ABC transporter ATP-binding protein [Archaeoglobaceae archaeon]
MIVARNVTYSYNGNPALEDVSFEIEEGELIVILGPNGAGKSTLLKILAGILEPQKGEIVVFGMRGRSIKKVVGYLPQRDNLNLEVPLRVIDVLRLAAKAKGVELNRDLLEMVGVDGYALFRELSGGQQQRVLIARTLIGDPKVILLDEPFNGVDVANQRRIAEHLRELADNGRSVVVVVHNVNPILHEADRVMLLNRRLVAIGKPNEVFTDENVEKTYGSRIPLVVCEEGIIHPLYGEYHA